MFRGISTDCTKGSGMTKELGIEVTLTLSDMKKVIDDGKVKELVQLCGETEPGNVGACVEDALMDRLTEIFSESEPDRKSVV